MPWHRRRICGPGRRRALLCALGAALAAGALACLIGTAIQFTYSNASGKHKRAKDPLSGYSPETIKRPSEKFGKSGR